MLSALRDGDTSAPELSLPLLSEVQHLCEVLGKFTLYAFGPPSRPRCRSSAVQTRQKGTLHCLSQRDGPEKEPYIASTRQDIVPERTAGNGRDVH